MLAGLNAAGYNRNAPGRPQRGRLQLKARLPAKMIWKRRLPSSRIPAAMPEGQSSDVKLEIGHVLVIDIVGYSKLMIDEQSSQLQTLKEIVRGTKQSGSAQEEAK